MKLRKQAGDALQASHRADSETLSLIAQESAERALTHNEGVRQQLAEAIASQNYDLAYLYAGQAVGLVTRQQSAAEVIQHLGEGAEQLLRERYRMLFDSHQGSYE